MSSRLTALDLTRFFAMLMMMQGHVIFALASPDAINMDHPSWQVWNFMRGITAPVFLFVSGIVHIFANKRQDNGLLSKDSVKKRIKTAFMLIGVGYLLVFPASKIYDLFYLNEYAWQVFFQVNVLQMFGVSLLLLLMHYLFTRNDKQLGIMALVTGLLIVGFSPTIHTIRWFDYLPEILGSYLTAEHGSIFPLFPFTGYLFLGTAFGSLLKSVAPEERTNFMIKYCWMIGLPLIAAGYPLMKYLSSYEFPFVDIMRVNPGLFFIRTGTVLVILSIMSLIYKHTQQLDKFYSLFGKRAIFIYVIHLFLIYGTPLSVGLNKYYRSTLTLDWAVFAALAVVLATLAIVYIYDKGMTRHKKAPVYFRYAVAVYLLYVFLV